MRKIQPGNLTVVFFISTILLLSQAPALASGQDGDIVAVSISGNLISFTALAKNDGMTLTVSGPDGFYLERSYAAGVVPTLSSVDENLGQLADGTYTFELRARPMLDDSTRAALSAARLADDESSISKLRLEGKLPSEPMVQSGSFSVKGGGLVEQISDESLQKDVVHLDDLIVVGSLCVGQDCINGESFGFDTLRLKENNLRINFQDTSTSSSFPTNDWRIVANDSTNGGANYLAFEDSSAGRRSFTVEAGARANALYVEADGDVGIGTANPAVDAHIVNGNTPTLRLEQDGSSGFTPQTWDLAGNEANFFIRDVTNGSKLFFRSKPGAPADSIFIAADGDIGMGTDAPGGPLHLRQTSAGGKDMITMTNNGPTRILLDNSASPNNWRLNHDSTGGFRIAEDIINTNTEFLMDGNGNVTITGTLTTAGATYPDYVFESGYELMELDELASFIDSNGHLPNVRPAAEVDGGKSINMTELQISLLEKVEELTLYTLEQHETIKRLSEQEAQQAATIAELLSRLAAVESALETES